MLENATENPNGGSVNVTQDSQGKVNDGLDNGVLSAAQKNIRERILAMRKRKEEQ